MRFRFPISGISPVNSGLNPRMNVVDLGKFEVDHKLTTFVAINFPDGVPSVAIKDSLFADHKIADGASFGEIRGIANSSARDRLRETMPLAVPETFPTEESDGECVPCIFMKDGEYAMGQIRVPEAGLDARQIWFAFHRKVPSDIGN